MRIRSIGLCACAAFTMLAVGSVPSMAGSGEVSAFAGDFLFRSSLDSASLKREFGDRVSAVEGVPGLYALSASRNDLDRLSLIGDVTHLEVDRVHDLPRASDSLDAAAVDTRWLSTDVVPDDSGRALWVEYIDQPARDLVHLPDSSSAEYAPVVAVLGAAIDAHHPVLIGKVLDPIDVSARRVGSLARNSCARPLGVGGRQVSVAVSDGLVAPGPTGAGVAQRPAISERLRANGTSHYVSGSSCATLPVSERDAQTSVAVSDGLRFSGPDDPKQMSVAVSDGVKQMSVAVSDGLKQMSVAVSDGLKQMSVAVSDGLKQTSVAVSDGASWTPDWSGGGAVELHPARQLGGAVVGLTMESDGWDRFDPTVDHSTQVAGVIALVSPASRVLPVEIAEYGQTTTRDLVEGIHLALEQGADVIHSSYTLPQDSPAIEAAVEAAAKRGVVIVTPNSVGASRHTLRVGSLESEDATADILAPSTAIVAPFRGGHWVLSSGLAIGASWVSGAAARIGELLGPASPSGLGATVEALRAGSAEMGMEASLLDVEMATFAAEQLAAAGM